MTRPHLAFVTTMMRGSGVGGHTFVAHLLSFARNSDLHIHFVSQDPPPPALGTTTQVNRAAARLPAKWLTFSFAFRRSLRGLRPAPSCVWFNNVMLGFATVLLPRRELAGVPLIGMINDYVNSSATRGSSLPFARKFWRRLERFCARRMDVVVVNSPWMRSSIAASYDIPESRIEVLHKAVELRPSRYRPVQHAKVIGYLKSDPEVGGLDCLIAALKELPEDYILRVAGPTAATYESYGALAEHARVAGRVEFLGRIPHDEVPSFLAGLDVFVNPARFEALGVATLEALATGVPVVARRVGGLEEVLASGAAGLLFDEDAELAGAVLHCFVDEAATRRRSASGRKIASGFSPDQMRKRIEEITLMALGETT